MSAGLVGAYVAIIVLAIGGLILNNAIRDLAKACKANAEANAANTRSIGSHTNAIKSLVTTVDRVATKTSINVTGITDPTAVAAAVKKSLDRRSGGSR